LFARPLGKKINELISELYAKYQLNWACVPQCGTFELFRVRKIEDSSRQSLTLSSVIHMQGTRQKIMGHFEVPDCMLSSHVGLSIQDSQIYRIIKSIILFV